MELLKNFPADFAFAMRPLVAFLTILPDKSFLNCQNMTPPYQFKSVAAFSHQAPRSVELTYPVFIASPDVAGLPTMILC